MKEVSLPGMRVDLHKWKKGLELAPIRGWMK